MVHSDPRLATPEVPRIACVAEVENAIGALDGRWKMLIVVHLYGVGLMRFSELRRAIPQVSHKMLIQQLRALEEDGVVTRTIHAQVPPRVDYELSASGRALGPVFLALLDWAHLRQQQAPAAKAEAFLAEPGRVRADRTPSPAARPRPAR